MLDTDASGDQFLEKSFWESSEVKGLMTTPCCRCENHSNEKLLREHLEDILDRVPKTFAGFQAAMESYNRSK